jgi:hypothetical protein
VIDLRTDGWQQVLSILECERAVIHAELTGDWPDDLLAELAAAGLLDELTPAKTLTCAECPEAPIREVIFTEPTDGGNPRALFPCPDCGIYEVPLERLRRWRVDRTAFITLLGQSLESTGRPGEAVAGRLWRLGRVRRGETAWSGWLGFRLGRRDAGAVLASTRLPVRSLLLVPGRPPHCGLPEGIVVGALRELTCWSDGTLQGDFDRLAELLDVPDIVARRTTQRPPARRQSRATDIDALAAELKQHLRAARDHAYHTRDTQGVPALLPRPTQEELAQRLGISESRVSRSLKDERAAELRLLWKLADDLEGLMRFGT